MFRGNYNVERLSWIIIVIGAFCVILIDVSFKYLGLIVICVNHGSIDLPLLRTFSLVLISKSCSLIVISFFMTFSLLVIEVDHFLLLESLLLYFQIVGKYC